MINRNQLTDAQEREFIVAITTSFFPHCSEKVIKEMERILNKIDRNVRKLSQKMQGRMVIFVDNPSVGEMQLYTIHPLWWEYAELIFATSDHPDPMNLKDLYTQETRYKIMRLIQEILGLIDIEVGIPERCEKK